MSLKELTREALEAEILALRKNAENRAAELAAPVLANAKAAEARYKELEAEVKAELSEFVKLTAEAKLNTVKDMFAKRNKSFIRKSYVFTNIRHMFGWDVAYYHQELEKALEKVK